MIKISSLRHSRAGVALLDKLTKEQEIELASLINDLMIKKEISGKIRRV